MAMMPMALLEIKYTIPKDHILLTILHIVLAPRETEPLWGYTLFLPKEIRVIGSGYQKHNIT